MKIKIKSSINIRSAPEEFEEIAKGHVNNFPNKDYEVNDRLIIKEYTGTKFTGKEIVAVVTSVDEKEMRFRKQAII